MKNRMNKCIFLTGLFLVSLSVVSAADWPRWRGPNADGISVEKDWDPMMVNEQNKPLWTAQVGQGFSAITVADGKAVTMGNIKDTDVVFCFDAQTGKEVWKYEYKESLGAKWYDGGTHGTPTVEDGKVYTLSKFGKVFCLSLADGKVIWQKELKFKTPEWGFAGSGVIVGDKIIFNVSDRGVALNKATGEQIWAGDNNASGYSTAVIVDQSVYIMDGENLRCVNIDTGASIWSYPWKTSYGVNAADPIVQGNEIFITSGYNHGCSLIKVENNTPVKVWENKNMRSQMSGPVLIDGFLYGIDDAQLVCLDWKTGEKKWTEKSVGKGSLMAADGKLIVIGEKGKLSIAKATPEKFDVISSMQAIESYCWTMPTLAYGKIYLRNAKGKVVCLDVSQKKVANAVQTGERGAESPFGLNGRD
jgi:outer membrane protein assembly factor BamB